MQIALNIVNDFRFNKSQKEMELKMLRVGTKKKFHKKNLMTFLDLIL